MITPVYNIISFKPTGANYRLFIQLSGELTIRPGINPDVFTAECSRTEFEKLSIIALTAGTLEFWTTTAPTAIVTGEGAATPDFTRLNYYLIDVAIAEVGIVAGEEDYSTVKYLLTFADHRYGFKAPRGGRLVDGIGNPDPKRSTTLIDNSDLATACLAAMGVDATGPITMDAFAPMRDIAWTGVHAATELQKILDYTAHVYCPSSLGGAYILPIGSGSVPSFGTDLDTEIDQIIISSLGEEVILISEGNPVIRTFNQSATTGATSFKFVVQDPDDGMKWKQLSSVSSLGADPLDSFKKGLRDVDDQHRDKMIEQMYRCIQLQTGDTLQGPIIDRMIMPDGTDDSIHIIANIATCEKNNAWVNKTVRVEGSLETDNVIQFPARLGTVTGDERSDLDPFFVPMTESAIKPSFSFEKTSSGKKVYAVYGFNRVAGVITAMTEEDARGRLSGFNPNTTIYPVPELRFVSLNNTTDNAATLASQAEAFASSLSPTTDPTGKVINVRGLVPVDIDGRVSQITYDQAGRTRVIVDGHQTYGGVIAGGRSGTKMGPRSRVATWNGKDKTVSPLDRSTRGLRIVFGQVVAAITDEPGHYTMKTCSGKLNISATGAFAPGHLGELASSVDAVLWYAPDELTGKHLLRIGTYVMGVAGDVNADGKLIVVCLHPERELFMVGVTKDGGSDGTKTTTASWTYTVTPKAGGSPIGTTIPLARPRPKGKQIYGSTFGVAFIDSNTLKLWDAGEVDDTGVCP